MEGNYLTLFADDMDLYMENMRKSVENPLETTEEFNRELFTRLRYKKQ